MCHCRINGKKQWPGNITPLEETRFLVGQCDGRGEQDKSSANNREALCGQLISAIYLEGEALWPLVYKTLKRRRRWLPYLNTPRPIAYLPISCRAVVEAK